MDTTILSALIAAFSAIIVSVVNSHFQTEKIMSELDKHNAVQDERIRTLTEKVEKHNSIVERTYKLEQTTAVMAEQLKAVEAKHD